MYTASDLRSMSVKELHKEKRNTSKDLYLLRVESANGQLKQHHKIGKLKRTIAKINTVLAEKELAKIVSQITEAIKQENLAIK